MTPKSFRTMTCVLLILPPDKTTTGQIAIITAPARGSRSDGPTRVSDEARGDLLPVRHVAHSALPGDRARERALLLAAAYRFRSA